MTQSSSKVPCLDCGREFLPRGLASHRRQKHAAGGAPKGSPEVPAEGGLEQVLQALERVEQRLIRLEQAGSPAGEAGDEQLRLQLDQVLAEVRAVQAERAAVEGEWADQRRLACDQELGRLRQRQARLLYDLDELPLV